MIGSGQETFGGRANINVKYQNVTFGANTSIAHILYDIVPTEDRFTKETIPSLALAMASIFPVYNEDGSYNFDNYNWSYKQQAVINPVALANEREDRMKRNKVMGKTFFSWEIIIQHRLEQLPQGDLSSVDTAYIGKQSAAVESRRHAAHKRLSKLDMGEYTVV